MKVLMDKQRAAVLAVGLTLALFGALALLGTNPAEAGHTYCTDNTPSWEQGTQISPPGSPVYLSTVIWDGRPTYGVGVCYGLPLGIAAGDVLLQAQVTTDPTGDRTVSGNPRCHAEPGVVTIGCNITYSTDTTDDGNASTTGKTQDASVGVAGVGSTGAFVNPATSTNAPLGGAAGSGGSLGVGTGTCTYVNGASPTCPFNGTTLGGVTVNEADLIPAVTPSTPAPPCTGVNNTCVPVGATVRLFQDTSNPTLSVTTVTSTSATTVDVAPTGTCVQVNATC